MDAQLLAFIPPTSSGLCYDDVERILLRNFCIEVPSQLIRIAIDVSDRNRDGKISRSEFVRLVNILNGTKLEEVLF